MPRTALSEEATQHETEPETALPSVRVVNAVAAAAEADPLSMAPLYDVVDPDALDQLVEAEVEGYVQFEYVGHEVTVHGDGAVVVDGQEHEVQ